MSETRKSRRCRFQYILRSLLLLLFLASLGLSWYAVRAKRAREQKEAVEEIGKYGGSAEYDYQVQERYGPRPRAGSPWPAWLRNLLGEDFLSTVVSVNFRRSSGDAGLEYLKGLAGLRELDLRYTQVTDTSFEHLKGLTRLETLNLRGTRVTDAGVERLKGLTQLQVLTLFESQRVGLDLSETQVTDVGLESLKQMTKLGSVNLYKTRVTDAGIQRAVDYMNARAHVNTPGWIRYRETPPPAEH
jgi:Leucine-rich repeat (LRR) protein